MSLQIIKSNNMKLTPKYIMETFESFTPEQWDELNKAIASNDKDTLAKLMGTSSQEMDEDFAKLHAKAVSGDFLFE